MAEKRELKLYNSTTRKAEDFVPREPRKVEIYVCGITAYDLGHARAAVSFDILFWYLYLQYDVTYVRNFTNVDSKITRRANEIGDDLTSLSMRYNDEYLLDMDSL